MPSREFDSARRERLRGHDPITFTLGGETLTCRAAIPIGEALDLADAPEPAQNDAAALRALVRFLEAVIVEDDREVFHRVIRNPNDPVDTLTIYEVVAWLGKEYSGRPTLRSTDSSGGPDTTGETSSSQPEPTASETSST